MDQIQSQCLPFSDVNIYLIGNKIDLLNNNLQKSKKIIKDNKIQNIIEKYDGMQINKDSIDINRFNATYETQKIPQSYPKNGKLRVSFAGYISCLTNENVVSTVQNSIIDSLLTLKCPNCDLLRISRKFPPPYYIEPKYQI